MFYLIKDTYLINLSDIVRVEAPPVYGRFITAPLSICFKHDPEVWTIRFDSLKERDKIFNDLIKMLTIPTEDNKIDS